MPLDLDIHDPDVLDELLVILLELEGSLQFPEILNELDEKLDGFK